MFRFFSFFFSSYSYLHSIFHPSGLEFEGDRSKLRGIKFSSWFMLSKIGAALSGLESWNFTSSLEGYFCPWPQLPEISDEFSSTDPSDFSFGLWYLGSNYKSFLSLVFRVPPVSYPACKVQFLYEEFFLHSLP